jgi:hypothetical protein
MTNQKIMSTSEDVMRTSTSPEVPRISFTISYPKITVSITSIRKDTQKTKITPRIAKPTPIRISFNILLLLKPLTVNPKRINRLFIFGFFRYLPIYNIGTINKINSIKELKIMRYGLAKMSYIVSKLNEKNTNTITAKIAKEFIKRKAAAVIPIEAKLPHNFSSFRFKRSSSESLFLRGRGGLKL